MGTGTMLRRQGPAGRTRCKSSTPVQLVGSTLYRAFCSLAARDRLHPQVHLQTARTCPLAKDRYASTPLRVWALIRRRSGCFTPGGTAELPEDIGQSNGCDLGAANCGLDEHSQHRCPKDPDISCVASMRGNTRTWPYLGPRQVPREVAAASMHGTHAVSLIEPVGGIK